VRIAARTTKATVALLAATALLAGCAKESATPAGSGHPPLLHIGSTSGGGPVAAAAMAPGPIVAPVDGGSDEFGGFDGYVLTGTLPTTPTQAPVWRWASTQATSDAVAKLAAALGVTGTPVRHAHGWAVSSAAGQIRVGDAAGQPWAFERSDLDACDNYPLDSVDIDDPPSDSAVSAIAGGACAVALPAQPPSPAGPSTLGSVAPSTVSAPIVASPIVASPIVASPIAAPPVAATATDAPVGEATARAIADPLIAALEISGPEQIEADDNPATVTVSPTVGGLATEGIETTITVDATEIESASGQLAAPSMGDTYPLRTATAAFTELNDEPRPMIARYCGPIAVPTGGSLPPVSSCPPPKPTPVTGATLGLLLEYDGSTASSQGAQLLVPAWFFDVQGATAPNAIDAIDPAFIAPAVVIPGGVNIATPDVVGPAVGAPGVATTS
jgi:hypothetical protein